MQNGISSSTDFSTPDVVDAFPGDRGSRSRATSRDPLHHVLENVSQQLHNAPCTLHLLDNTNGELVPVAMYGLASELAQLPKIRFNQGIIGWVAVHREIVAIMDVTKDPRIAPNDGLARGSVLCAPVIEEQIFSGVLCVSSDVNNAFSIADEQTIAVLAEYISLAVERTIKQHVDATPTRQLQVIVEAARSLTSLIGPQEVFANILKGMGTLINFENGMIFAYQSKSDELQVMAVSGSRGSTLRHARVSMKDPSSLSVQAARSKQAKQYSPNNTPMGRITESFLGGEDVALLCVPLLSKNILHGVVTLTRTKAFSAAEMRTLTDIAPLIATGLENVALYQSVKTEQERLSTIISATSDGICVINNEMKVDKANTAMLAITGLPQDKVIGQPCTMIFGPASKTADHRKNGIAHVLSAIRDTIQHGINSPMIKYETTSPKSGEEAHYFLINISPIPMPSGGFHAVLIIRDITQIQAIEKQKADFLRQIEHELRTPIHALGLILDHAIKTARGTGNSNFYDYARKSRMIMKHITGRVLDLFQLANDKIAIQNLVLKDIDMSTIIEESIAEVEYLAELHAVVLHPPTTSTIPMFKGDEDRLEQVLRNLLANAIHHTPKGGHVWITTQADSQNIELAVTDTGCGIPKEYQQRIFEKGYQIPGEQKPKGEGLGLYIVRYIVELHHGTIEVISFPGQGSKFIVHLPRTPIYPLTV